MVDLSTIALYTGLTTGSLIALKALFSKSKFGKPKITDADLEARLAQRPHRPNNQPDNFAVLISGLTDRRHKDNLVVAYQTLQENGFEDENIYILDYKGKEQKKYPVTGPASKNSVEGVFHHLSERMDVEDYLFVYVTNHGERSMGKSTIVVPGPDITEKEFEAYLEPINSKQGVLLFDQCYSGGFAQRLGNENYVAISACEPKEMSTDNTFPQAFFEAFRDVSSADLNYDGKISMAEAFVYAKENDWHTQSGGQTPLLISEINPEQIFLGDKNPDI